MNPSLILSLSLLMLMAGTSFAPASKSKHIANYNISVELDPDNKLLRGKQTLTWHNDSSDHVKQLQFHLYMNAFKNEKSTFMRERLKSGIPGGFNRPIKAGQWGWINITRIHITNGPNLKPRSHFIHPDDNNKDDQTVLQVDLPSPVPPQGKISLDINFVTQLPRAYARTGYRGDYFFVGQWFPKIGVYEKKGMRGAKQGRWNCHQYHSTTEYYANFGMYNVTITAPSRFVIGATGKKILRKHNQGKTSHTFQQADVVDFAWTAYPNYKRFVRTFHGNRETNLKERQSIAKQLALPLKDISLRKVKMIFLLQPAHTHLLHRHVQGLKASLRYYGLWYGAYPHDTITLVDPAWEGNERATSGMEYPTLFTAGTRWLVHPQDRSLEHLIVHEFGHQFFQGLVASNEFEEAWMDEGINTYTDIKVMNKAFPDNAIVPRLLHFPLNTFKLHASRLQFARTGYLFQNPKMDRITRRSWRFQSAISYGKHAYAKPGLMLATLERILGKNTMARVMRTYVQRWRYRHPTTRDFIDVVNQISKRDMTYFFQQFLHGTNVLDYAINSIRNRKVKRARGIFGSQIQTPPRPKKTTQKTTKKPSTRPKKNTQKTTKKPSTRPTTATKASKKSPKKTQYTSTVLVQRRGEIIWPVEIEFTFSDGKRLRKRWDGKYRWKRFSFTRHAKLISATVDPDKKLLMDINFANNSKTIKPAHAVPLKWSVRMLFWIQNLMHMLTLLL